jgi:hypothetical protein
MNVLRILNFSYPSLPQHQGKDETKTVEFQEVVMILGLYFLRRMVKILKVKNRYLT